MRWTSAASNGSTASEPDKPGNGLMALHEKETKGLISLACDALSQTHGVAFDLHQAIYVQDEDAEGDRRNWLRMLNEALGCLAITEHYLLMLSSVFEEQDNPDRILDPWANRHPDRSATVPELRPGKENRHA